MTQPILSPAVAASPLSSTGAEAYLPLQEPATFLAHPFRLILNHTLLVFNDTGFLRAARFGLRGMLFYKTTARWLRFMHAHPYLARASDDVRRVLSDKIHRPFARCGLTPEARTDLLIQHYLFLSRKIHEPKLLSIVNGERHKLAEIKGRRTNETYSFTFCREMLSQHQGELAIMMWDPTGLVPLARLVANIATDGEGRSTFIVNGIQGPGGEYKGDIVAVTRDLDGLRPKRAVLEIAAALARLYEVDRLIAISKKNHVSQTRRKWQQRVRAEYDEFWQEFTVETQPNGDYVLPLVLLRRNLDEVAAKKRKAWLIRMEHLDSIAQQVLDQVHAL